MKSFKLLLASLFALTALVIPTSTSTAATGKPGLVEQPVISAGGANKLPSVAVGNGNVHVAWSGSDGALYKGRTDESGTFPTNAESLGSVGGSTTYFNAAVAVGDDGTVHYTWINGGSTILYRNKRGAVWSAQQVVARFEDFANSIAITAKGNNEIFISWRHQGQDPNGYIRFAYSNNAGASWPIVKDAPTPTGTYAGRPYLAAGPNNGPAFLAWTGTDGSIYVGQWNGDNFASSCISCPRYGSRSDFFNPTISVGPDGRPYVAWRSVGRGVFYGSRQDNGTWGLSNVFPHSEVAGPVSIDVDSRNNVHLAWISKQSGSFDTWYAVKLPSEPDFSQPIVVSLDSGIFKANVDMTAIAKQGHVTAHIVWESFGGQQVIRYARVQTNGIGCSGAAVSEHGESQPRLQTIPRNPIYFPMVSHPVAPTPPPTC
jgi:hypothetical protein